MVCSWSPYTASLPEDRPGGEQSMEYRQEMLEAVFDLGYLESSSSGDRSRGIVHVGMYGLQDVKTLRISF